MNDIVMAILSCLLAVVLVGVVIIFILLIIWGILDIIGDIADWFIGRFGK